MQLHFAHPDGGGPIAEDTSRQIVVARVLCIFFMMSVHVSRQFDAASYGSGDVMHWIGPVWIDVLGRSSVPALSVVSGFLMSAHFGRRTFGDFAFDRFRTLCLPMLFWTAILATIVFAGREVTGNSTLAYHRFFDGGTFRLVTEHMLFLYGHPANVQLGFLRDLFVCSLIALLFQRQFGRYVFLALPVSIVIWQTTGYGDLILRPAILSFVLAGIVLQRWRGNLSPPKSLRVIVRVLMLGVVAQHWFGTAQGLEAALPQQTTQMIFRCIVSVFALDVALLLSRTSLFPAFRRWEPMVYLAYLSHGVIICCLREVLEPLIGDERGALYPVFFLAAPLIVLMLTRIMTQAMQTAPPWVRLVTSGKPAGRHLSRSAAMRID